MPSSEIPVTGDNALDFTLRQWFEWNPEDHPDSKAIKAKLAQGKVVEVKKAMMSRLAFGTAGLRGKMGPG